MKKMKWKEIKSTIFNFDTWTIVCVQLCLVYYKAIIREFFALLIKFKSIVSIKAQVNLINFLLLRSYTNSLL